MGGFIQKIGQVKSLVRQRAGASELTVEAGGDESTAFNYPELTGEALLGDMVLLNTTARALSLGSGGVDFICHNLSRPAPAFHPGGHIMKLRYTPWQFKVLSCEEKEAGRQGYFKNFRGLQGMPVLIGELHSMLAPAAAVVKRYRRSCRIAYLMTDGAALPISFSRTVSELKERQIIAGTVTCGHSFGGDLEAVNVYSALAACRQLLKADIVIMTMGPGNVGTGTRLGFSGMEVGEHVNRVNALGGIPVVIPRISMAEQRRRHRGISHHTVTALAVGALSGACLPLPYLKRRQLLPLLDQLARRGLLDRFKVQVWQPPPVAEIVRQLGLGPLESMGRSYFDDPVFFQAPAVAAVAALRILDSARHGHK